MPISTLFQSLQRFLDLFQPLLVLLSQGGEALHLIIRTRQVSAVRVGAQVLIIPLPRIEPFQYLVA